MATTPDKIQNHDIIGLSSRINRFITELQKSASSSVAHFSSFDADRLGSYLDAVDEYHAFINDQPQLDLPESAPMEWPVEQRTELVDTENESVNDACRMFWTLDVELLNSQSARMPAGLISFDSTRLGAISKKIRAFLTGYISKTQPIDLPESSPREHSTGHGERGVEPTGQE